MSCFGDNVSTQQTSLPGYLTNAAQANVAKANDFASTPFQAYTGEKTAGLTPNQTNAFNMVSDIAGSSNPYLSDIQSLYNQFSSAPAQSISAPSMLGGSQNVNNTTISDYMNPYISGVLAPQLQDIERQGIKQRQGLDAQSTMAGAFGDARLGVERGAQQRDEGILRTNTIGSGYGAAYDKAAALRGQDVTNNIGTQTTNANLAETALQRAITGGNALNSLDQSQVNRGLTTANALASAGKTEQATNQAADTANMAEFLRGQGWTQQQIATVTAALAGTPHDSTTTTTTPNNTGQQLLGAAVGAAANYFLPGSGALMGGSSGGSGSIPSIISGSGNGAGGLPYLQF